MDEHGEVGGCRPITGRGDIVFRSGRSEIRGACGECAIGNLDDVSCALPGRAGRPRSRCSMAKPCGRRQPRKGAVIPGPRSPPRSPRSGASRRGGLDQVPNRHLRSAGTWPICVCDLAHIISGGTGKPVASKTVYGAHAPRSFEEINAAPAERAGFSQRYGREGGQVHAAMPLMTWSACRSARRWPRYQTCASDGLKERIRWLQERKAGESRACAWRWRRGPILS